LALLKAESFSYSHYNESGVEAYFLIVFLFSGDLQCMVCSSGRSSWRPFPQVSGTSVAQWSADAWARRAAWFCRRSFCTGSGRRHVAAYKSRPRTFHVRATLLSTPLLSHL